MIRINIEKIKKLRNYLDDTCYDTLNQKIRQHQNYFFNPLPNEYDNIQLELLSNGLQGATSGIKKQVV